MKKIICELCDGSEFKKENGMFVCQSCGTSYSVEEARGMMREVECDVPTNAGTSGGGMPVGNPNQAQIDNLLMLATNAFDASNNEEAEGYCNRVIELDASCYKAWFLKGKAIGWTSTLTKNRMEEAAHSFCQAIDFAPEDEKDELKKQAVEELKKLGLACISLRKDNFAGDPSDSNLNGFKNDRLVLINALKVLLSHGNIVGMPDGYLEEIASMMATAAGQAMVMAKTAWHKVDYPTEKDLVTYIDWMGNCEELLQQAIDASDNDDEADKDRYDLLIMAIEEPIDKYSYKQEWNTYLSEYVHIRDKCLNASAVAERRKKVEECKEKIAEIEKEKAEKEAEEARKAAEEKQARIDAYWEAHAEEKAALEKEREELNKKIETLDSQIKDIDSQISSGQPTGNVPSEIEKDKIKDQIRELENKRANLGMFAGKEKKRITEEIAALRGRMDSLKQKAEEEKSIRQSEYNNKVAPLTSKRNELHDEQEKARKRVGVIYAELTKDPEE